MRIHFIAIGGAVMHNLALALHYKGFKISGSDDNIYEPAKTRLKNAGILPSEEGWNKEKITNEIDAIILGMHARNDNPELQRANELGIKVYSFPEFLYEQTKNKKRIVIAGSHGKTTITSMILHVLKTFHYQFDYMVGAQIEGFDTMVGLSNESEIAIFEGDEYTTSPLDLRPKFVHYKPHIAVISGIEWDHINVYPTFDEYKNQFKILLHEVKDMQGKAFIFGDDEHLKSINNDSEINVTPYYTPEYIVEDFKFQLILNNKKYPLQIFGKHNMQNLEAARLVCESIGIQTTAFYEAMQNFSGAAKRLEPICKKENLIVYRDFAHAPSKLKATIQAIKELYPNKKITAIYELHTFSSLNKDFIQQYFGAMNGIQQAFVYYSSETILQKKMELMSNEFIAKCFGIEQTQIINDKATIKSQILECSKQSEVLLLMSSGTFDGFDFNLIM